MEEQLEKHQKFNELMEKTPDELKAMGLNFIQDHYGYLGVSAVTYNKWRKRWEKENRAPEDETAILDDRLRELALSDRNPKYIELYLKRLGMLNEKKEDNKFELSVSDRIRIAREVVNGLREDNKRFGGNCPVCGKPQTSGGELRENAEPKHEDSRIMEGMELSS